MDEEPTKVLSKPTFPEELFARWQFACRGEVPAEDMSNPVWEWLFRGRVDPYQANLLFAIDEPYPSRPRWAGCRLGQSQTRLADGRTLWIAGEHEDFYDPDFYIYNDVIVEHPDGRVEIRCYPAEVFPPTDFHSATAIDSGRSILIIGSIGYHTEQDELRTPVYRLDTYNYQIDPVETTGTPPGWLNKHTAELSTDGKRLLIRGGQLMREHGLIENIDDWELCLERFAWTRLTDRNWPMVQIHRADGNRLHLFAYSTHLFELSHPGYGNESGEQIEREIGAIPALDAYTSLFVPSIEHEPQPERDEALDDWRTTRVVIDGVLIRFVDDFEYITLIVEGQLEPTKLDSLIDELVGKLQLVENSTCTFRRVH